MKSRLALLIGILALTASAAAKEPARNVSGKRHPNLAAAQHLSAKAFEKLEEAQRANEFDLAGHAKKAKDLLAEANSEIKLAAETSNQDRK